MQIPGWFFIFLEIGGSYKSVRYLYAWWCFFSMIVSSVVHGWMKFFNLFFFFWRMQCVLAQFGPRMNQVKCPGDKSTVVTWNLLLWRRNANRLKIARFQAALHPLRGNDKDDHFCARNEQTFLSEGWVTDPPLVPYVSVKVVDPPEKPPSHSLPCFVFLLLPDY